MEMSVEETKVISISRQSSPLQIMLDQKQLNNAKYFNYLGTIITNDAIRSREIKSRIAVANAAFNRKNTLFTSKLDLNVRKILVKFTFGA
jgi:hypothetical protein